MLTVGNGTTVLLPRFGGAVLGWAAGAARLLRMPSPEAVLWGDIHGVAAFPLVPFCNRIGNGRFQWLGQNYQLDRNMGDHPHTIHGVGWRQAWTVEAVTPTSTTWSLSHDATGVARRAWPFAFDASMNLQALHDRLVVTIAMTNRHDGPAPGGIGLHPYFPRVPNATLQFSSSGVWINDPTALPRNHEPVPAAWDHASGLDIGTVELDNCFTGWTRRATFGAGASAIALDVDPIFTNLQVFTPPGEDFYCVEPVSHAPDAINRRELGPDQSMHTLEPGETLRGTITLRRI